jgi:hypothetical protein
MSTIPAKPIERNLDMPSHWAGRHDPDAALHVCAKCDGEQGAHQALPPRSPQETKMFSPQNLRNRAAKRCAICDGKFGLIRHYSWRPAFCSKKCADRFKARQEGDRRWLPRLHAA